MKKRRWLFGPILWTLLLVAAGFLWMAGTNLWSYFRMRTVSVEVIRSSLLFDALGKGNDLDITLLLDLKTTDGSERAIHWEEEGGHAAYPEEAYDVLRHWAPGSLHEIRQMWGQARKIRLPDTQSSELMLFALYLVVAACVIFFALAFAASDIDGASGVWLAFFFVGVAFFVGAGLFAWFEIPKRISWPSVVATRESAPDPTAEAPPLVFPDNVAVTPAARKLLERSRYVVLRFNGFHAGLGSFGGRYESLKPRCESGKEVCRFVINPQDRWDVELNANWDDAFYAPLAVLGVFGLAFGGAGLLVRRFGG